MQLASVLARDASPAVMRDMWEQLASVCPRSCANVPP